MNETNIVVINMDLVKARRQGNGNYTFNFQVKEFYSTYDIVQSV